MGTATCITAFSILITGRSIALGQVLWINTGVLVSALILAVLHGFLSLRNF